MWVSDSVCFLLSFFFACVRVRVSVQSNSTFYILTSVRVDAKCVLQVVSLCVRACVLVFVSFCSSHSPAWSSKSTHRQQSGSRCNITHTLQLICEPRKRRVSMLWQKGRTGWVLADNLHGLLWWTSYFLFFSVCLPLRRCSSCWLPGLGRNTFSVHSMQEMVCSSQFVGNKIRECMKSIIEGGSSEKPQDWESFDFFLTPNFLFISMFVQINCRRKRKTGSNTKKCKLHGEVGWLRHPKGSELCQIVPTLFIILHIRRRKFLCF